MFQARVILPEMLEQERTWRMALILKSTIHMLARMWRERNPFALWVGVQTGAATEEISMEIPQKIKNGPSFGPSDPTSRTENTNLKNISTPMFISAFSTITNIWKQPKCPSIDEWINQLWDIYTMEHYWDKERRTKFYPL